MSGKVIKMQRREFRKQFKKEVMPVVEQAKLDVKAVQDALVTAIVNLPFKKRLRFCYGVMFEGRVRQYFVRKEAKKNVADNGAVANRPEDLHTDSAG